ncbi:MAG: tetratricopeptide repeat protein, partial [Planctomycetota bacterium]
LLGWLHRSGIWRLAFLDDAAAVFVRRRSGVGGPDLDLDGEALFPPLPGRLGRDDFERRRARANLLYALHRYDRALSLGEKNAARYPDDAGAAYDRARFLFATGNAAAGDVVLDGLLRERPGDARLMARAADLRVAAGRRDEAAALYDAALALDPTLENALAARARLAVETGDPETARALYRRLLEILAPADPAHAAISKRLRRIGDDPPLRRGGE